MSMMVMSRPLAAFPESGREVIVVESAVRRAIRRGLPYSTTRRCEEKEES
jgi:hypothetical protein